MPSACRLLLLALLAALVTACAFSAPPALLEVRDVSPRVVSTGERLVIQGAGFPEGVKVEVRFNGTLHRPGTEAEPARISAEGRSRSSTEIELVVDAALERRFCGALREHTTFKGQVRVAFAPRSGTTAVGGLLASVSLEVVPSSLDADVVAQRQQQAQATLAYLGITPASLRAPPCGGCPGEPGPYVAGAAHSGGLPGALGGLRVAGVDPRGPAARAGVLPDDMLAEVASVSVLSLTDVRFAPRERRGTLRVARNGYAELQELAVDISSLHPASPADLALAAGPLGIALALLLLVGPLSRAGTWAERAARRRMEHWRVLARRRPPLTGALLPMVERLPLPARAVSYAMFVAVCVAFTLPAFGKSIHDGFDLGIVYTTAVALLIAGRLAYGGAGPGPWSLIRGLGAALRALLGVAPGMLALAGAALTHSSLSLEEGVFEQGAFPWQWAALKNPALLLLASVLFATAALDGARTAGPLSEVEWAAERTDDPSHRGLQLFAFLGDRAYVWASSAVVATVFFGGWAVSWDGEHDEQAARLIGVTLFYIKLWGVAALVHGLRGALGRAPADLALPVSTRVLLPLAVIGVVCAPMWARLTELPSLVGLPDVGAGLCSGLVLGLIGLIAHRLLLCGRAHRPLDPSVNPWL